MKDLFDVMTAEREEIEQAENLERVKERLDQAVLTFCRKCGEGNTFFADDLRRFVDAAVGKAAPGSADRILRSLRQQGIIEYTVLNRAKSQYRVDRA